MRTIEPSNFIRAAERVIRILGVAFCLLSAVSAAFAQDDTRVAATWQVAKYDLTATPPQTENDRNLVAKASLEVRNVSARPASTLTLRINKSAVVSAVTINGTAADFTKGEEKLGNESLQRIVVRVPSVQPGGILSVAVDYKLEVGDNSGLHSISPISSQFLPLSFWYPTPNSWYFTRGADYAPVRIQVNAPGQSVVSSGTESGGVFDQKLDIQPFFVTGSWDTANAAGVSVLLPKGAGADEQKLASELAAFASEARTYVANLLGAAPDVPVRLVAVRRAGGFSSGGTIFLDDSVFRRGRLDSFTAMNIAESIVKIWFGGSVRLTGDGSGVIREGLTKYIATQFLESKFGKEVADVERLRQRIA